MTTIRSIRSRRSPSRPVVICLHCSGSSGRQWARFADRLGQRATVFTPDLLGYRDSTPWQAAEPLTAEDGRLTLDDEVEAILPMVDEAGDAGDGVHLIGHSFGGSVALQLARRRPQSVRSLTLYEPVRFGLLLGSTDRAAREAGDHILATGQQIRKTVLAGDAVAGGAQFIDYWSGAGTWAQLPEHRRQAVALRMPKVADEFDALFRDPVPLAAYGRLNVPVHLLVGARTLDAPREVARLLASILPAVSVTTLPGLGHMGPVTNPDQVLSAMLPFLAAGFAFDSLRMAA